MPDQDRAIERARDTFVVVYGVAVGDIAVIDVSRQQIPNPPLGPGQVSTNPVRYRFFVTLRAGATEARYRVEGGKVYND